MDIDHNNTSSPTPAPDLIRLASVIYAYAAHGLSSFESYYRRSVDRALRVLTAEQGRRTATRPPAPLVTEGEIESLPGPVARYVRQSVRQVSATFTRGKHTVTAHLMFNEHDQLAHFTSDDRFAVSAGGRTSRRQRWSTPLNHYTSFHGRTISASAQALWHGPEPEGPSPYLEFEVDGITYQSDGGNSGLETSMVPSPPDGPGGASPISEASSPSQAGSRS